MTGAFLTMLTMFDEDSCLVNPECGDGFYVYMGIYIWDILCIYMTSKSGIRGEIRESSASR